MQAADVVRAVETSDKDAVIGLKEAIRDYTDPWEIHLALYPAVAGVLNPPFINPHLPKMYHICRDFRPYLSNGGLGSLVYLESLEYARRAKLEQVPAPNSLPASVSFDDIERAIAEKDRDRTALLFAAFFREKGWNRLCRQLMMLGSGYLGASLGHSISCTALILLELLERSDTDSWPVLLLLSDYFCKGGFQRTPALNTKPPEPLKDLLSRAVRGTGFVDLHHTITLFAIERIGSFLSPEEKTHLIAAWEGFVGDKDIEAPAFASFGRIEHYGEFSQILSLGNPRLAVERAGAMLETPADRSKLCSFLVTGVCDLYQGDYDPHYLTGLAALFWVIATYHEEPTLVRNALYQYLAFYLKNPGQATSGKEA